MRLLMSAFRKSGENKRLGEWTGSEDISSTLQSIVFDCAIDNTISFLDNNDKISLKWFQEFLSKATISNDGEDDFETSLINQLIGAESIKIQHTIKAPTSTDVSMTLSHTIEPKSVAARIITEKENVLHGKLYFSSCCFEIIHPFKAYQTSTLSYVMYTNTT